jgi:aminoglycoside 6'-N-acetyltransferase I
MQILDLTPENTPTIEEVATLLVEGFATQAPDAWPDLDSARQEVQTSFAPGRISLVALDTQARAIGWIGGIEQYDGHVWEFHPLVVDTARRRQGIGRALVAALEDRLRERGALTLWLGTDDEIGQTTLAGVNLYPDVWAHIAAIRNLHGHPCG